MLLDISNNETETELARKEQIINTNADKYCIKQQIN